MDIGNIKVQATFLWNTVESSDFDLVGRYTKARDSLKAVRVELANVLRFLNDVAQGWGTQLHLMGHSMGCALLMEALAFLQVGALPTSNRVTV